MPSIVPALCLVAQLGAASQQPSPRREMLRLAFKAAAAIPLKVAATPGPSADELPSSRSTPGPSMELAWRMKESRGGPPGSVAALAVVGIGALLSADQLRTTLPIESSSKSYLTLPLPAAGSTSGRFSPDNTSIHYIARMATALPPASTATETEAAAPTQAAAQDMEVANGERAASMGAPAQRVQQSANVVAHGVSTQQAGGETTTAVRERTDRGLFSPVINRVRDERIATLERMVKETPPEAPSAGAAAVAAPASPRKAKSFKYEAMDIISFDH